MKILIPTPIFPPEIGGPATYVSELAKRLSIEHEIVIITFTQDPQPTKNTKVVSISLHKHFLGILFRQLKLAAAIYKYGKNADLIYAQGPVVVGFTAIIVGKILSTPTIVKFVGDIAWEEAERRGKTTLGLEQFVKDDRKSVRIRLLQRAQKLSLQWADKIVVPSEYLKKILRQLYKIQTVKIEVIDNAVAMPKIKKDKKNRSKKTILASGRLVSHKRFDLVIQAFKALIEKMKKEEAKKLKLVIVGDGPERKRLQALIHSEGLHGKVKLVGSLGKGKYYERLASSELFVLASSYEGLSHAIIEAMLLKVPVVASDIPGNRGAITNGKTGILVPARVKNFAEAIQKMLTDEQFAERVSKNAKKNAQERFTWETHLKRLVHLFRQELTR